MAGGSFPLSLFFFREEGEGEVCVGWVGGRVLGGGGGGAFCGECFFSYPILHSLSLISLPSSV